VPNATGADGGFLPGAAALKRAGAVVLGVTGEDPVRVGNRATDVPGACADADWLEGGRAAGVVAALRGVTVVAGPGVGEDAGEGHTPRGEGGKE
jgi:hypothetical protein